MQVNSLDLVRYSMISIISQVNALTVNIQAFSSRINTLVAVLSDNADLARNSPKQFKAKMAVLIFQASLEGQYTPKSKSRNQQNH